MPPIVNISPSRLFGHALGLFLAGLILSSFSSRHPEVAQIGHSLVSEISTPVQQGIDGIGHGLSGFWDEYINLVGLVAENESLRGRLSALESENSKLLEAGAENLRLRQLLRLSEVLPISGIAAHVIGYDPSTWIKAVTLDKGLVDGVVEGASVIDGRGVVGRIISVTRRSSRVILLSDHASAVDAVAQRTRARGVVMGTGQRTAKMEYVSEREDVRIGDRIITSGLDGIFPKGLFVGVVTDVSPPSRKLFRLIDIEPATDFSKIEDVLILSQVNSEITESALDAFSAKEESAK
jgi:rod shape-determining protein MreC